MEKRLSLEERLSDQPELLKRFEEIAGLVANEKGEIVRADDAELRAIEEVRLLGAEIMRGWASRQNREVSKNFEAKTEDVHRNGKKNCTGIRPLGK
jgi:hypothetical protein